MKLLFLALVATAYIASAVPVQEQGQARVYPRFVEIPDGEGNTHQVDLEAEPDLAAIDEYTRNPNNIAYLLFTRRNPNHYQTLEMNNAQSIVNSNFNPNVPTIVIVHGWLSNRDSEPNPTLRSVYLTISDVNIITVCWRDLAARDYITAVNAVPVIGREIGDFVIFLNGVTGARLDQLHLTGYSLGAHTVGNAGRALGGNAARVTGFDPSGPLWTANSNRLSPTDGVYVEAIHTDGGIGGLGIGSAIADVDFFPNGGNWQPGCITNFCNHERAWQLFAVSLTHTHLVGRQCSNTLQIATNTCNGAQLPLGTVELNKIGRGMFRLNTGSSFPF